MQGGRERCRKDKGEEERNGGKKAQPFPPNPFVSVQIINLCSQRALIASNTARYPLPTQLMFCQGKRVSLYAHTSFLHLSVFQFPYQQ